jgi:hypothetical protein
VQTGYITSDSYVKQLWYICYFQEAMRQVPDCEDEPVPEIPPVTTPKKKRRTPIQVKPLPPAGKGILISPGFRCVNVWGELCHYAKKNEQN